MVMVGYTCWKKPKALDDDIHLLKSGANDDDHHSHENWIDGVGLGDENVEGDEMISHP